MKRFVFSAFIVFFNKPVSPIVSYIIFYSKFPAEYLEYSKINCKAHQGFPDGSAGKASACSVWDLASIHGFGRVHGEGIGNYSSILGKPHGQRSLAGYRPMGHKELNTMEWLSTRLILLIYIFVKWINANKHGNIYYIETSLIYSGHTWWLLPFFPKTEQLLINIPTLHNWKLISTWYSEIITI